MTTEYSIQKMVSDGTLSIFALGIEYLQRSDIYLRVAGEETPQSGAPNGYTWSFVDNTTIKILPVVPNGVEVVAYRRTDADSMYNVYSQNAQFDEATIDENNTQLLFLAQEYMEQGSGIEAVEYLRSEGNVHYYRLQLYGGRYTDEFTIITQLPPGYERGVGDFVTGFTVMPGMRNVAWLNPSPSGDNNLYSWSGEVPPAGKVVPPNSTPETTGGFVNAWVPRTDETLRVELAAPGGAGLIGPGVITRGADKFSILQGRVGGQFGADVTRGIGVHLAEPITGSGLAVNTAKFNYVLIDADRFNAVDDLIPGTKVDGLLLNHKFGGPGTKGGRHAAEFILEQTDLTEATNTDRNYVGCVGFATSSTGDGGTSLPSAKGAYFGGNFYGTLTPGAMYTLNVTGAEFNVGIPEGASSNIRTGLQIGGTKEKRGDVVDAGISVGNMGRACTWRTGIAFGPQNGGAVFGPDSRVLSVDCEEIDRVLSLSSLVNVNHIIYHNKVKLSTKSLQMEDSGAFLSLGTPDAASTTSLQARTSGTNSAYDSRLLFSGGSSVAGTGTVSINAGIFTFNCTQRPSADNQFDYGSATFRGRTAYFGTGTINTSDGREKTAPLPIDDAILDAWGDVQLVTFQWLESIRLKGEDEARWHFGVIAQQVRDAFAARGLDGTRYGLLCYDEWEATPETTAIVPAVLDEDSNIITPERIEVTQDAMPAGNRWGIRADQCLFLEAAYQRRRCDRIEQRLCAAGL